MTTINNTPHRFTDDPVTPYLRGAFEHRATWMYLLMDEAAKAGLDWDDFARKAILRCGHFHGDDKLNNLPEDALCQCAVKDLVAFHSVFTNDELEKVFEMVAVEEDKDHLTMEFHYCPLIAAWQKQGCSDEEIAHLCDIAMDGDRGIAEKCGLNIAITKKIADGDDVCRIEFTTK